MNRLGMEKSPYLLQHAGNPVDWYPWGDDAFAKAEKEDKPVFLSIGYSTCHWCHVMEAESFEDREVAAALNRDFVCVKVDREERPDIDSAYMNAVQAMGGQGGWPLNVFLTPGRLPFYGGAYFTPAQLGNLLPAIAGAWKNRRGELAGFAAQVLEALAAGPAAADKGAVPAGIYDRAFSELASRFDPAFGGFGAEQKFPSGHTLSFLLLHYYRAGRGEALEMAEKTLAHIAGGGLFDRLGGGVHRYATDREWFLPHFEKMLYDQATLANAYLEAYQLTKKEEYAAAARKLFGYVLRDLSHGEGGFYSAEDADSAPDPARPGERAEGAYYVWTKDEVLDALGKAHGEIFCYRFGVKAGGNVNADPRREFAKKNVLAAARSLRETAERFKRPEREIEDILGRAEEKLLKARARRPRPRLDDKVLTDWNGLMISSLARGGGVLGEPEYIAAAGKAADFILGKLKTGDGTLLHRYRDKTAGIPGFLDDYAFFINGLLDLYEAAFETRFLEQALELAGKMLDRFKDGTGGFFRTAAGAETILSGRVREYQDGAYPCGNSLAVLCLARLSHITRSKDLEAACGAALAGIPGLPLPPSAYAQLLIAADAALNPSRQIVIVAGGAGDPFIGEAASLVRGRFLPGKTLLLRAAGEENAISAVAPWVKGLDLPPGEKTTVYVCVDRVCLPPVTSLEELAKTL